MFLRPIMNNTHAKSSFVCRNISQHLRNDIDLQLRQLCKAEKKLIYGTKLYILRLYINM